MHFCFHNCCKMAGIHVLVWILGPFLKMSKYTWPSPTHGIGRSDKNIVTRSTRSLYGCLKRAQTAIGRPPRRWSSYNTRLPNPNCCCTSRAQTMNCWRKSRQPPGAEIQNLQEQGFSCTCSITGEGRGAVHSRLVYQQLCSLVVKTHCCALHYVNCVDSELASV